MREREGQTMTYSRDAGTGMDAGGGARGPFDSSVIDADSHFNGVFRTSRDLYIEGEYEGEIHCEGVVTVAEHARVTGNVSAGTVSVAGTLQGDVNCSGRFEILESGQVSARVAAAAVILHHGAFYEGDLRMLAEPSSLSPREVTESADGGAPAVSRSGRRERQEPTPIATDATVRNGRDQPEAQPATSEAETRPL
jgi:cytoskeletal protein CcmA (bactofilin family)